MKARQYRRCEHFMRNVYGRCFGVREPYQLLVDDTFCVAALQHGLDLKERLPLVLGGAVRLMTTGCVADLLRTRAREHPEDALLAGAPSVARRLELRRCRHDPPLAPADCIASLVGTTNPHHYGVLSHNDALKIALRAVPGVPIVYLERVLPLLEPPSRATLRAVAEHNASKLGLSPTEAAIISKRFGTDSDALSKIEPKHKHRRAKGPNPLSVKKPTRAAAVEPPAEGPKRQRKRRKSKAKEKEKERETEIETGAAEHY